MNKDIPAFNIITDEIVISMQSALDILHAVTAFAAGILIGCLMIGTKPMYSYQLKCVNTDKELSYENGRLHSQLYCSDWEKVNK